MNKSETKNDIDQHYVDLINNKIAPVNDYERQFLKEVKEAESKGQTVEIPVN